MEQTGTHHCHKIDSRLVLVNLNAEQQQFLFLAIQFLCDKFRHISEVGKQELAEQLNIGQHCRIGLYRSKLFVGWSFSFRGERMRVWVSRSGDRCVLLVTMIARL